MKIAVYFSKNHYYIFVLIYASLLMAYFLSGNDYLFLSFNIFLILSASFLFSFIASKWLLAMLAFVIPFSIQTDSGISGISIFFPSELLTGVFAGVAIIKIVRGEVYDKSFFLHPVTLLIAAYFFLTVATGIFSSMPGVSIKAILVKGVYFLVFYFLVFDAFKNGQIKTTLIFIFCYSVAFILITMNAFNHFSEWSYSKKAADLASLPFYKDHTIYSACIAFLIPVFAFKTLDTIRGKDFSRFILNAFILVLLFTALFFSFSRAAWISFFAALIFFFVLVLKIRPLVLLGISALLSFFVLQYSSSFFTAIKKNKSDSNMRNADIEVQTKSILNISTDLSNAERLNRWKCALRMISEKPLAGFGSGTYMFQYFPYQRTADMTPISVTSPYNVEQGHGGSVHSEYLLVLSENGIFTFIVFALLVAKIIFTGMKNFYNHPEKNKRMEAGVLTLCLVTYLVHSFFNNFLDTDKAAFLFWSSACMIVMIDLSRLRKQPTADMNQLK